MGRWTRHARAPLRLGVQSSSPRNSSGDRRRCRALTGLLGVVCCVGFAALALPRAARADDLGDFLEARDFYTNGEFGIAATRFGALVARPSLARSGLLEVAREYYAASLLAGTPTRRDDAREVFTVVLRENPDAEL